MATTFLDYPIISQIILPFILVFAVLFAALQKSKILGDDRKNIDIIVSLVLTLITISFAYSSDIISQVIPVFSIGMIVVLVVLVIMAFSDGSPNYKLPNAVKWGIGIIFGISMIAVLVLTTGLWDYLKGDAFSNGTSSILSNVIFAIIIAGVIAVAAAAGGKSGGDKKK